MKLPWPDLSSWSLLAPRAIQVEVTTRGTPPPPPAPHALRDVWHNRSLFLLIDNRLCLKSHKKLCFCHILW